MKSKRAIKVKTTNNKMPIKETFEEVVRQTPDISTCYKKGLSALGKYSNRIQVKHKTKLEGSVDIDSCATAKYPNDSRWDYALSYKGETFFVEVHSANTAEVKAMLKKLQWLKDWLNFKAPLMNKSKARVCFFWVQSKDFQIPKSTPQYFQAIKAGIRPVKILDLDQDWQQF